MILKPCSCGRKPEVKYMAGIERSLAEKCGLESSTPYPRYYVSCECGQYKELRVIGFTEKERDKQKNQLIRMWNNSIAMK